MNRRTNILTWLRRSRAGAARHFVAAAVIAYLFAGMAPCAMAASHGSSTAAHEHAGLTHEGHARQAAPDHAAHSSRHDAHGTGTTAHDESTAPVDHTCPHCPHAMGGDAALTCDAQVSCFAFDDLTNGAPKVKDAPQPVAPLFGPASFALPPPLASPRGPPPSRNAAVPAVPLNLRHCVFLI